jgi:hypothetical protein
MLRNAYFYKDCQESKQYITQADKNAWHLQSDGAFLHCVNSMPADPIEEVY